MAIRMQQRRGTSEQWTLADPVLATGEIGWESDTNKFKIGDGINNWSDLSYFLDETALGGSLDDYVPLATVGEPNGVAELDATGNVPLSQLGNVPAPDFTGYATETYVNTAVSNLVDAAPATLDTLNELAAALNDDASFATTITNSLATKQDKVTGVSDTEIGYLDGVTSAIQTQLDAKANATNPEFTVTGTQTTSTTITGITWAGADQNQAEFELLSNAFGIPFQFTNASIVYSEGPPPLTQNLQIRAFEMGGLAMMQMSPLTGQTFDAGFVSYINGLVASPNPNLTVLLESSFSKSISSTEVGYLDGVTSAIQTQLGNKANLAGPTFTGTVTLPSTTSIGDVSATELGYVNGVTSSIQTQLNGKANTNNPSFLVGPEPEVTTVAITNQGNDVLASTSFIPAEWSVTGFTSAPNQTITNQAVTIVALDPSNFLSTLSQYEFNLSGTIVAGEFSGTLEAPSGWNPMQSPMLDAGVVGISFQWLAGASQTTISATELGYLDGVTSNIQTQINNISPDPMPQVFMMMGA